MKHSLLYALTVSVLMATPAKGLAQEQIYPHHFNLNDKPDSPRAGIPIGCCSILTSRTGAATALTSPDTWAGTISLPSPWPMPPARTSRLALCSSRDSTICSVF